MNPYFFLGLAAGIILGIVITVFFALCTRSGQISDQEAARDNRPPSANS